MHKTGEVQTTCLLTEIFCFFPTQKHEHKGTKREPRTQACTSGIPGLGRIDPYDTHIKAETEPNKKLILKREITVQAQSRKSLFFRYPFGRKDKTIKKKSAPNATCASRHSTGWAGAIRTRENDGVKVRCLTPWLYPNLFCAYAHRPGAYVSVYHTFPKKSSVFSIRTSGRLCPMRTFQKQLVSAAVFSQFF